VIGRLTHIRASDEGASALEFAIVVPVLMMLIFGMLEFGFMFQAQLAVTHAAREGARLAAVNDPAAWSPATVEQRAYPLTVADGLSIARDFPDAESVRVTVTYPWQWRVLPLGDFLTIDRAIVIRSSAIMRVE
jgi:Flp pilus assembly protein TadG